MTQGKGSWGKLALGCGVVLVLALLAAAAVGVALALRPEPTLSSHGGVEIVLVVDVDRALAERPDDSPEAVRDDAMEQVVETLRRRVDELDVADPVVVREGDDRVVVQLAGVTDAAAVTGVLTQTARLELRMVDEALATAEVERLVAQAMADAGLGDGASDEQIAAAVGSWVPQDRELLWERAPDPSTGAVERAQPWLLMPGVELTGAHVGDTSVSQDQFGQAYVALEFNAAGTERFCDLTRAHTGEKLAIVLDDVVLSVPTIQEPICGGQAQISMGAGSADELHRQATDLAVNLRAGALAAPVSVESTKVIGPAG